ncbi:hypothetical protein QOT17_009537 [Balamuthia mandrillaris]
MHRHQRHRYRRPTALQSLNVLVDTERKKKERLEWYLQEVLKERSSLLCECGAFFGAYQPPQPPRVSSSFFCTPRTSSTYRTAPTLTPTTASIPLTAATAEPVKETSYLWPSSTSTSLLAQVLPTTDVSYDSLCGSPDYHKNANENRNTFSVSPPPPKRTQGEPDWSFLCWEDENEDDETNYDLMEPLPKAKFLGRKRSLEGNESGADEEEEENEQERNHFRRGCESPPTERRSKRERLNVSDDTRKTMVRPLEEDQMASRFPL